MAKRGFSEGTSKNPSSKTSQKSTYQKTSQKIKIFQNLPDPPSHPLGFPYDLHCGHRFWAPRDGPFRRPAEGGRAQSAAKGWRLSFRSACFFTIFGVGFHSNRGFLKLFQCLFPISLKHSRGVVWGVWPGEV